MASVNILVIEDDPDGQEMVSAMLEHMNYSVETADDGEEATDMLFNRDTNYHVAIIDLALPGKDGWDVLEEILGNPQTENIPCIAVTAYHNSKLREDALRAGFTAYFPKPIDGMQLGREIDRLTK